MIHKIILTLLLIIILFNQQFDLNAQVSKQNYEILRLIRHEKFDLILPDAMRDNNVDMWIHVTKDGDPDPLDLDLGGNIDFTVTDTLGYYIFTDRGGDRIERALFGGSAERCLYELKNTQEFGQSCEKFVSRLDAVNNLMRLYTVPNFQNKLLEISEAIDKGEKLPYLNPSEFMSDYKAFIKKAKKATKLIGDIKFLKDNL